MALKNSQYDQLMREYNRRRFASLHEHQARMAKLYQECPRLEELTALCSSAAAETARAKLGGSETELLAAENRLQELRRQKSCLLSDLGLTPEDLEVHYTCPDCKDTGYIGQERCHCFRQASISLLYQQSHLQDILKEENFDRYTLKYYASESEQEGKPSVQEQMKRVRDFCRRYAQSFHEGSPSLLFSGNVGVGKTFLSHCIARDVIESCHSVVYLSATQLFDSYAKRSWSDEEETVEEIDRYTIESDLLIIDDLGTEHKTDFTIRKLFYCINERLLRKRSTIISTNLRPSQLRDLYTDRIASRIISNYQVIRMPGTDIRVKKKYGETIDF